MGIREEWKEKILLFDGGTGSLLQEAGLGPGELPETWNVTHPEVLVHIHREYLAAGCDVILANTFGANRLKYNQNTPFGLEEIVTAGLRNARRAVQEAGRGYVALDLGPTGRLLKPMGDLDFEEAVSIYREVVEIGVREGADLILIETMNDTYELKAAVLAAKENSDLPVLATTIYDERGKLLTGAPPRAVAALLEGLGVDGLGINCGLGPAQMRPMVEELIRYSSVPVIVNPNAGLPRSEGGKTVYDVGPEEFAAEVEALLDLGVSAIGGCCGTTPEHIRLLHALRRGRKPPLITKKQETIVTSYAAAVEFGRDPVIIGERINPTGKPRLKAALREHNLEYILQEAIAQQENGAAVLDVNVGLPGIDEPAVMAEVVQELQGVTELPLQIDTAHPAAMERALRLYNGKALINSVNGKQAVMDAVFPLVRRYGGVVVALTLDEAGIPETAEGRIAVAKKICAEAAKYGIGKKDIIIDALCMAVSADPQGALTTLETVRRVREELGMATILGVSNISFGLPGRENINAVFFAMALQKGLTAAILNPNSKAMMRTWYSYRALAALDENCGQYIGACERWAAEPAAGGMQPGAGNGTSLVAGNAPAPVSGNATPPGAGNSTPPAVGNSTAPGAGNGTQSDSKGVSPGGSLAAGCDPKAPEGEGGVFSADPQSAGLLRICVEKGLKDQAARAAAALLESCAALDIINQCMIPALDRVGQGFEKGTVFLPQLLMSAEAARAAFDVIKANMEASGQAGEKKGAIVLATVKGDIHDIGKNIVRVLLENYGYEVRDLGRDVSPEQIVRETVAGKIRLVGLSALMTTTVPSMEETIRLLRREAPWARIMVGGAVLTPEYAASIGADAYCRDAMASVKYAEQIFGDT